MKKSVLRAQEGRKSRLEQEVNHQLYKTPITYRCIYLRFEQANQYKAGWNSVTAIDIDVEVKRYQKKQKEQTCSHS